MDKAQALHNFWSGFGIPAFDETSVPDEQDRADLYGDAFPYITYTVATDSFEAPVTLNASLWYKSNSWADISKKTEEIAQKIEEAYPITTEIDNGRIFITKGRPFAQRMEEPNDDNVRRMYLTISVEYLTRW